MDSAIHLLTSQKFFMVPRLAEAEQLCRPLRGLRGLFCCVWLNTGSWRSSYKSSHALRCFSLLDLVKLARKERKMTCLSAASLIKAACWHTRDMLHVRGTQTYFCNIYIDSILAVVGIRSAISALQPDTPCRAIVSRWLCFLDHHCWGEGLVLTIFPVVCNT